LKRKEKVAKRERGDKNTLGDHILITMILMFMNENSMKMVSIFNDA
jgi:hypothetical protein